MLAHIVFSASTNDFLKVLFKKVHRQNFAQIDILQWFRWCKWRKCEWKVLGLFCEMAQH